MTAVPPALQGMLAGILARYWERAPTAQGVMEQLGEASAGTPIFFDHFAFRTFGVPGLGISSIAQAFTHFGYSQREQLSFPAKKLNAYWLAPPGANPALPRVFVSELLVDQLSTAAQAVIRRYTDEAARSVGPYAVLGACTGALPWEAPTWADIQLLSKESEYAAWTLNNGYALNHAAVSVHRLAGLEGGIRALNEQLLDAGVRLNEEGGVLKVSPDGGLLQSSTTSDTVQVQLSDGSSQLVAGPYLEFTERLVLPEFAHLPASELCERHRREGFEVGNADKIFESTRLPANA